MAGCLYTSLTVASPITFVVDDETWRSAATGSGHVAFLGIDGDDNETWDADVVFLVWEEDSSPDDVLDLILAEEWIESTSDRRPVEIGGLTGVSEVLAVGLKSTDQSCPVTRSLRFGAARQGLVLIDASAASPSGFGIPSCATVQAWAIASDGGTITILATARFEDQVDTYVPVIEEFLNAGVTFETAGR